MRIRQVILLISAASLLAASAGAVEKGWRLRLNAFYLDSSAGLDYVRDTDRLTNSGSDTGVGGGINAEYRFSSLVGLEFGVLAGTEVDYGLSDSVSMSATCAGVNFHFATNRKADVYAGPLVAVVQYSDFSAGPLFVLPGSPSPPRIRVRLDTDYALGANLGVDLPLGEGNWLFNANARYLVTKMAAETSSGVHDVVNYDPLMLGFGFGYRF